MALDYTDEQLKELIDNGAILVESTNSEPLELFTTNIDKKIDASKICHAICSDPYNKVDEIVSNINLDNSINFFIDKKEIRKDYKEYNEDFDFFNYNNSLISYIKFKENNQELYRLICDDFNNISDVEKVVEAFKKENKKIDRLAIRLKNKDYEDIEKLKELEKEYNTEITYDNPNRKVEESEDFLVMRKTINYYKSIIDDNLSPLEKLTYAYDLIKSFEYTSSENQFDSRQIHLILKTGKIVCAGYSAFMEQLLKELDIEAITVLTQTSRAEHARNVVKLKDEKYDIDGIFALDATWDSARNLVKVVNEDGTEAIKNVGSKRDGEVIEKYYDNLSLYRCFLIPISDYNSKFRNEEFRGSSSDNEALIAAAEPELLNNDIKPILPCNNRPNFDKILRAIAVVRLKEGYSKEAAIESIKGIIEINDYYDKSKSNELETAVIKNNF